MARTTQYIGLNDWARRYVKEAVRTEQHQIAVGISHEPVMGSVYYLKPPYPDINSEYRFTEVVQVMPWSSGPMIFTALKCELVKKSGQVIDCGTCFEWMVDPSVAEQEYDITTGRYYV